MAAGVQTVEGSNVPANKSKMASDSDSSDDSMDGQHMSDEEFPITDDDASVSENEATSKWALTMAKYLKKTADAPILSKAARDIDLERKRKQPKPTFEVVGVQREEGHEEKPDELVMARELLKQKILLKKERQNDILRLRVKPSIKEYEREKLLKKVATRGTVQLFNAVRQQQKDVNKKLQDAGKIEYKRDKVLKNLNKKEFLNVLMNGPRAKSQLVDNLVKQENSDREIKSEENSSDGECSKSTWGALRADFLSGKKSGWDKEDDSKGGISDKQIDETLESE